MIVIWQQDMAEWHPALRALRAAAAIAALACSAAFAADEDAALADIADSEGTNRTVITSKSLEYDAEHRLAVFEGNVKVADPQMTMLSDSLTIVIGADDGIETITARGKVAISQDEIRGTGEEAVYDVAKGKIVLSGSPRVIRGKDELSGEIITLYRETGRILCEPNAVLRLHAIPASKGADTIGKQ